MFEFSYRPNDFYGFYRKEESDRTLMECGRDVDVLVTELPPPSFW